MRSRSNSGKYASGVLEDLRVGFGDADDVAVDHAPHRDADAVADLTDLAAKQLLLDLPAGVADDAHRHASPRQRCQRRHAVGDRPPPQLGRARDVQQFGGVLAMIGIDTDRLDVGAVVLGPEHLTDARRRLDRHRRVVGAAVSVDRRDHRRTAPAVGQHRRIRQHEHAAGVEQDGVERVRHSARRIVGQADAIDGTCRYR